MAQTNNLRKNPSRETCEGVIKRILVTENLEHGRNRHFKNASDFMGYFESLYPASDALTKQVQRAIKSLDMPKDEQGYLIVNKTTDQFEQEKKLSELFRESHVSVHPMEQMETVFLTVPSHAKTYLAHMLQTSELFRDRFLTMVETSNGLLIYTQDREQFLEVLNSLTI